MIKSTRPPPPPPKSKLSYRSVKEWDTLAKWVINHKLLSHNVRWLIQVPRLYNVYKAAGQIESFEDIVKSLSER